MSSPSIPHGTVPLVRVLHAGKRYGPVRALSDVTLDFLPGQVHALVGQNGAGKSTLMRLLAGEEMPSEGEIIVNGQAGMITSPHSARAAGISVVHQQFQLVEAMTVAENIFLGKPARWTRWGPLSLVDRRTMRSEARLRLAPFGLAERADDLIRDLTVGEKQLVEICKALEGSAKVLVLDEPTASLGDAEIGTLFRHIDAIKTLNAAVVLIAHNIEEVLSVADRISVLRDGKLIDSRPRRDLDADALVRMIAGHDVDYSYPKAAVDLGATALAAVGAFRDRHGADGVSVNLRKGEILGVPSFIGSMVDDFLDRLSGAAPYRGMSLQLNAKEIKRNSIASRIRSGLAFVPGNAASEGTVAGFSIEDNILLPNMVRFSRAGFVSRGRLRKVVEQLIAELNIRPPNPQALVKNLSGGNRQKVVIAKWLASGATVFVMNDPTKAVDVGAKAEIYRLLSRVVEQGGAVLLASSDTDELVGIADQVVVIRGDEIVARFPDHPVSKEALLSAIVGSPSTSH